MVIKKILINNCLYHILQTIANVEIFPKIWIATIPLRMWRFFKILNNYDFSLSEPLYIYMKTLITNFFHEDGMIGIILD